MSHLQYSDYEGYGQTAKRELHYSQAVRIGDRIEISGQGGWDRITENIPQDISKEIDQAFANVEHALEQAGGKGWDQVYKVRIYTLSMETEAMADMVRNLRRYCPNHCPLLTGIGVKALGLEGMRIEIEVTAHLGS